MSNFTGYLPVYLRNPVENGAFMFRHQRIISFFPIKNKFSLVKLLENFSKGFLFCWNVSLVLGSCRCQTLQGISFLRGPSTNFCLWEGFMFCNIRLIVSSFF